MEMGEWKWYRWVGRVGMRREMEWEMGGAWV